MATLLLNERTLIKNANDNIEENIRVLCPNHIGLCAQNILSQTRNLLDGFALLKYKIDCGTILPDSGKDLIGKARKHLKNLGEVYEPFNKLYGRLEIIASHYTQNLFDSESLLLRYADLLHGIKAIAKQEFGIDILANIDDFPFSLSNKEYYLEIMDTLKNAKSILDLSDNTYYIEKKLRRLYGLFEYVLSPANDKTTKFDRITVFSFEDIKSNNAIKCTLSKYNMTYKGIPINVVCISTWIYSIRPCELNKLAYIVKSEEGIKRATDGYNALMSKLTELNIGLFDFVISNNFDLWMKEFNFKLNNKIKLLLDKLHYWVFKCETGHKTIRYLLYTCRHSIIKLQTAAVDDMKLGNTNLKTGCFPFDNYPFAFSLVGHNPRLEDLLECLAEYCTEDELLKRALVVNTEDKKMLYSPVSELDKYFLTKEQSAIFNKKLFEKAKSSSIQFYKNYAYISSYEEHTASIIRILIGKDVCGDPLYSARATEYLNTISENEIDDDKKRILKSAFNDSSVVLINGSAGTGKTTLIKHFSNLFKDTKILFLSCTNSSVQNLHIKVGKVSGRSKKDFYTLEKFRQASKIRDFSSYRILVVDESSMAENEVFDDILTNHDFDKLILVGDERQIESIRFGNWFGVANHFLSSSYELSINHRTSEHNLCLLWDQVRLLTNKEGLCERFINSEYHRELNNELFKSKSEDEVILSLNYDGLYGINNLNRYLQEINPNKSISWKVWTFKKGDKILFNESYYFRDYFYNNQKGIIENIQDGGSFIKFEISVEQEDTNNRSFKRNVQWIKTDNNRDYYSIIIDKDDDDDEDENNKKVIVVPFQLGYAISIHKSQGLEYESVKVVFTKEVEEQISHNIFYTAITRTKKELAIFCDKTSLSKIIDSFDVHNYDRDSKIIAEKYCLPLKR